MICNPNPPTNREPPIDAKILGITATRSRSSGFDVKLGNIDQYGISMTVYVIPHTIYIIAANIYKLVPDNLQSVNKATKIIALTIVPIANQGLNLPHLLWVLSTIIPIPKSLTASQNFAKKNNVPTNEADNLRTSVKYNIQ